MTQALSINSDKMDRSKLIDALSAGSCVGLPTETVYGLAADATNGLAVAKIFEMKGRPQFNPLICHVASFDMALEYGSFDQLSADLAKAFWPGPLTLVVPLRAGSEIHPLVCAGLGTIGIRAPQGPASELIAAFGKPLAAPSANRSGRISPTTASHVMNEFPDEKLAILDAGPCKEGVESTIVKVMDGDIHILRPGSITPAMITEETGKTPHVSTSGKIEAPGMMLSHYAPNAQVKLNCIDCHSDALHLGFGEISGDLNLSQSGSLREAAANLYRHLKELDARGASCICVAPIPNSDLGLAINDRLNRAAAPRGEK